MTTEYQGAVSVVCRSGDVTDGRVIVSYDPESDPPSLFRYIQVKCYVGVLVSPAYVKYWFVRKNLPDSRYYTINEHRDDELFIPETDEDDGDES